jgi:hypothetical protein
MKQSQISGIKTVYETKDFEPFIGLDAFREVLEYQIAQVAVVGRRQATPVSLPDSYASCK